MTILPNVKPVADMAAAHGTRVAWLIRASVHAHRNLRIAKADIYEALARVSTIRAVRAARREVK